MQLSLKDPYICVTDGRTLSYGGNQMRQPDDTERKVGCGVVAGLDLLLYLARAQGGADIGLSLPVPAEAAIPLDSYIRLFQAMRRKYLPLIPGHGINGLLLALGLDLCFRKAKLPYTALWGVPYDRLWGEMERMLADNIPVVFAIGPNFPLFWQNHKLTLYRRNGESAFAPAAQTHAHYVTVTGMDAQWLRIASWGREFYIRREEYLAYVKAHSLKLVSNLLLVRRRSA